MVSIFYVQQVCNALFDIHCEKINSFISEACEDITVLLIISRVTFDDFTAEMVLFHWWPYDKIITISLHCLTNE